MSYTIRTFASFNNKHEIMAKNLSDYHFYEASPFLLKKMREVPIISRGEVVEIKKVEGRKGKADGFYQRVSESGLIVEDTLPYVKVFKEAIKEFRGLSPTSLTLLFHIMDNLKPKSDVIELDITEVLTACEWTSRTMYYRALLPLLDAGFLAKKLKTKTTFFVNSNKIFNGSRRPLFGKIHCEGVSNSDYSTNKDIEPDDFDVE